MSVRSTLNLKNKVSVTRETVTNDGMGGMVATTVSTILSRAAIWQTGASSPYISDQVLALSSHILACLPGDDILYTDGVTYNSRTFEIVGHPENVQERDRIKVVALKEVNG